MIVADKKPIEEVIEMVKDFQKILIAGCNECVTVCEAGGKKEVGILASALRMYFMNQGKKMDIDEITLERQCDHEYLEELRNTIDQYDAVLSLGCGAGVQAVAEMFSEIPVLPALNTEFLGETRDQGLWVENCLGCGDCMLDDFGGVCPLARCSKQLLNGPCGGSKDGKCEINPEVPCAWQAIIDRLDRFGSLDRLEQIYPPKDWSRKQGGGPRKIMREDQQR